MENPFEETGLASTHASSDHAEYPASPHVDDDALSGFIPLDPRVKHTDRIASVIFTVVVFVVSLVGLGVVVANVGTTLWFWIALGVVVSVWLLLLWTIVFWPSIEYRHKSWRLNETGLEIRRGVWWKHQIAVPWARVQHADVSQGPLQRMFGLGSLTVHTAGTSDSSITIDGLEHGTALLMRDEVIRQRKAADVV